MDQPVKPPTGAPPREASPMYKARRRRGFALPALVVLLIVAGVVWWTRHESAPQQGGSGGGRGAAAPMSIVPETVSKGDIGINLNALGTVTSLATVIIRSQISGYLMKIDFKEGDEVRKGDLIAEIDSRPYEATLAQAKG